jgi:hypothetical protein
MTSRVAPRSVSTRCYGQCTVLMKRPGGLTTADAAWVTPYLPGTFTPYPASLYGGPDTLTPLVFPVAAGDDGVVALWADAPGRLELEAVHPVLGRGRVLLDLEPTPAGYFLPLTGGTLSGPLRFTPTDTHDIGTSSGSKPRNLYLSGSVAVQAKAGVPVDSDFTAPIDGMLAVDTTANALYFRANDVWHQATGGAAPPSGGAPFGTAPFGTAPFGGGP